MAIEQFDKLQQRVKELVEQARELRMHNNRLLREMKELKERINRFETSGSGILPDELDAIKKQNEKLKHKNQEARTRLNELIHLVEKNMIRVDGVDKTGNNDQ